jgi:capsular polysaccharide biosynthesis protein
VGNYAAWLFGVLPRLAAFEAAQNMPILLHGDVAAFHRDSLRAMGIDEKRLRMHRANVRVECKELHYCTSSYVHHAPSATGVRHVRERVTAAITPGAAKRVYFARRHAKDRPLLNEAEVIALFEQHGFIAIDPEQHSFEDQARYAAGAEILAGPYGANLANLVFARNAKKLLIQATKQQPEFARLASALGVAFWHTIPQAVQLREGRTFSESFGFSADLTQLARVVDTMLAS